MREIVKLRDVALSRRTAARAVCDADGGRAYYALERVCGAQAAQLADTRVRDFTVKRLNLFTFAFTCKIYVKVKHVKAHERCNAHAYVALSIQLCRVW